MSSLYKIQTLGEGFLMILEILFSMNL